MYYSTRCSIKSVARGCYFWYIVSGGSVYGYFDEENESEEILEQGGIPSFP
jgi:hypothetical protein